MNSVDYDALLQFEKYKIKDHAKVFEVGGEGGLIAIYSDHNEETGTPWYYFEVNDMGFEEEDIRPTCRKSELTFSSWKSLMSLRLNKPYFQLSYPLLIDEDFQDDLFLYYD